MKIAIMSPGSLPLPAVKGGAIEGLIDTLINFNEENKFSDLFIFSIYDEEAKALTNKYKNSTFIYSSMNRIILSLAMKRLIPMRWYYKIYCYSCLKKLEESKVDVIIIQNEFIYADIIKKRIKTTPLILHLHNDYVDSLSKDGVTNNLKGIVTISDYLKNKIRENDKKTYIETVHNGVDLELFKPCKTNNEIVRKRYNMQNEDFVIIYAGRLIKEKGVFELISAVSLMEEHNIKLIICGGSGFKGSEETLYIKRLKNKAKECNQRVIFTGFISHDKLPEIYQCADIGCIPSLCEEAFGLTVVEQMASGLPVVVSDAGAIPEIVNEDSAIIVKRDEKYIQNIRNALETLYYDIGLRMQMANSAIERAKIFSKDVYVKNYFEAIDKIIKIE